MGPGVQAGAKVSSLVLHLQLSAPQLHKNQAAGIDPETIYRESWTFDKAMVSTPPMI